MANWIRVAAADELADGSGREVVAEGRLIGLFRIEGRYHAVDGSCPHQAGPLGKGTLDGCVVTCPRHGLQVNVVTGEYQISTPAQIARYEVKVESGDVFVDLDSADDV